MKPITEELCGHSVSASTISGINKRLDKTLTAFAERELDEPMPCMILDARYEKVRDNGVIRSQAVLIGIGIGWNGGRHILGVELANRESRGSWKDFLVKLRERGLHGVEFVVSDDHDGLRQAIREVLNEAAWLARWQATYPRLTDWVEDHIEQTWTFYRLPRQHHKHLKSTNMLERLNEGGSMNAAIEERVGGAALVGGEAALGLGEPGQPAQARAGRTVPGVLQRPARRMAGGCACWWLGGERPATSTPWPLRTACLTSEVP